MGDTGVRARAARKIRRSAFAVAGIAALVVSFASTAQAQCNFVSPIGPGGQSFEGFLAATSNAVTSTVTALSTGFQTQTSAFVASPQGQPDQFASGAWVRSIGGRLDEDSVSLGTRVRAADGQTSPVSCSTDTRNDFDGFQFGTDIGRLNWGGSGWNGHVGLTAGYFETEARSQQGSGVTRSEVPFVGAYGALINGGFFIDAQLIGQFYQISTSEPSIEVNNNTNATGIGFTSSAGYNWKLGDYFVEPSASVVYANANIDPFSLSPSILAVNAAHPLVTLPTVLDLGRVESLLGRAGVRVGTNFITSGVSLQPFVAASVWREFAGQTSLNATFSPPSVFVTAAQGSLNLTSSRIGTFGQYSVGFSASILNTGWLGYTRLDFRDGENIEAISVNAGLRYQFAPEPPSAAAVPSRMVTKAPVSVVQPSWTGLYIGAFAGGGWSGNVTATELTPTPSVPIPSYNGIGTQTSYQLGTSGIAGLTIGYNYQIGTLVPGFEAEGGYLRFAGSAPFAVNPDTVSSTTIGDWYTLFGGRLGFLAGPVLMYGKVGAALVSINSSVIDGCALSPPCAGTKNATVAAAGGNDIGMTWGAGAGLEYALNRNWSVKAEYLHLATDQTFVVSGPGTVNPRINQELQTFNWSHSVPSVDTVKVGINYRFSSSAAVVAGGD